MKVLGTNRFAGVAGGERLNTKISLMAPPRVRLFVNPKEEGFLGAHIDRKDSVTEKNKMTEEEAKAFVLKPRKGLQVYCSKGPLQGLIGVVDAGETHFTLRNLPYPLTTPGAEVLYPGIPRGEEPQVGWIVMAKIVQEGEHYPAVGETVYYPTGGDRGEVIWSEPGVEWITFRNAEGFVLTRNRSSLEFLSPSGDWQRCSKLPLPPSIVYRVELPLEAPFSEIRWIHSSAGPYVARDNQGNIITLIAEKDLPGVL